MPRPRRARTRAGWRRIWELHGAAADGITILFWAGWATVFASTWMISHAHLFGLRQVHQNLRGEKLTDPEFQVRGLYRMVRHPIMLGFIIAFWATATMSAGHLLFAAASTGSILVALQLEERDLIHFFGERYQHYRARVRMLVPLPKRVESSARDTATES